MSNRKKRWEKLCFFIVKNKLWVLLLTLAICLIFAAGIPKLKSQIILQDMFPTGHPYLKLQGKFSRIFGSGGSGVIIAVNAKHGDIFNENILNKVKRITEEVELWDEVYRQLTFSIASQKAKVIKALPGGEILIDQLMFPDVPANEADMNALKKAIFSSSDYNGVMVALDGSATIIRTELKENISYQRTFELFQKLIMEYSDKDASIHVIGFPVLMGWIFSMGSQMQMLFAISIGLMVIVLWVIFRNINGMLTPMILGCISTSLGLGFAGWMGMNFSPLLYVLGFLVGARVVSHGVQITHRYFEELTANNNDKELACYHTMHAMVVPNAVGVLTDAAGFTVLILAKIVLMKQLALIMTFWMMSIAVAGVITPILCTYMPLGGAIKRWSEKKGKIDLLHIINVSMANYCIGPGKKVVVMLLVVVLGICLWKASHLKIGDPTPGSPLLWADHKYNTDQALIDSKFLASSDNLSLYFEGSKDAVYDPDVLKTFDKFSIYMARNLPDLYKSYMAINSFGKRLNMIYHDGDPLYYQLPRDDEELLYLIGQIRSSVGVKTLTRFITPEMDMAQASLFFSDHTSENMIHIRDAAYDFFENNPAKTKKGEFKLAGGRIGMEIAVNDEMKESHFKIDLLVLTTIFVMCSLCFRSIVAGLMLTVPLLFANFTAFAYMSIANIGLSINTLPVAAIGVGVGVDFAIYLYSRCIEEYRRQEGWVDAIMVSVATCGKAIVFTCLSLILPILPWVFLSDLKFQAQMGLFLSMLLFANAFLALTLHPLLIYIIKPKFMSRIDTNIVADENINTFEMTS